MRHLVSSAVLFLTVGVATSETNFHTGSSTTDVIEALSAIDFMPGVNQIGNDVTTVGDIANSVTEDPGVRLRAYRSLGQFDDQLARDALKIGIDRYHNAESGTELLYLIAAAEGLGQIAGPEDVAVLAPLLDAPSRDLRVVIVRALGHVADGPACLLLRRRLGVEGEAQVEATLNETLTVCP